MALPNVPFGIRARGVPKEYISVKLYGSNAAIGIGDLIAATANGPDKLATNTSTSQTAIMGVACEKKAANAGGYIQLINPKNQEFEAQALNTGDNYSDPADIGASVAFTLNVSPDSNTGVSTAGITSKPGSSNGAGIITGFGTDVGNTLVAGSYPIIRFVFRPDRLFPYTTEI